MLTAGRDESRLRAAGVSDADPIVVDLHDTEIGDRVVSAAIEQCGVLDGVVLAAGVVAFGAAEAVTDDVLLEMLTVNFLGPARLTGAALRRLPAGGFVVSISAIVAELPTAGMAAYSASKAALTAFNVAARTEARRRKIRVIDVRPPHTETGLADRPIAGSAPMMRTGLDPDVVAERIVRAIVDDETELPSTAFAG